jgi:hypothetical protein
VVAVSLSFLTSQFFCSIFVVVVEGISSLDPVKISECSV